jgi:hypothetical protein
MPQLQVILPSRTAMVRPQATSVCSHRLENDPVQAKSHFFASWRRIGMCRWLQGTSARRRSTCWTSRFAWTASPRSRSRAKIGCRKPARRMAEIVPARWQPCPPGGTGPVALSLPSPRRLDPSDPQLAIYPCFTRRSDEIRRAGMAFALEDIGNSVSDEAQRPDITVVMAAHA